MSSSAAGPAFAEVGGSGEAGVEVGGSGEAPAEVGTSSPAATVVRLTVNGSEHELVAGHDFAPDASLADVLRDVLGLTGVKVACDQGACGACTVIMDGRPVLSCMTLATATDGAVIHTVEGLGDDDPLIVAFANQSEPGHGTAIQCGYCSPGMVMAAKALLMRNPTPTRDDVVEALAGNICRCGCYPGIVQAVLTAARSLQPPA